jgi:hypothetical protein
MAKTTRIGSTNVPTELVPEYRALEAAANAASIKFIGERTDANRDAFNAAMVAFNAWVDKHCTTSRARSYGNQAGKRQAAERRAVAEANQRAARVRSLYR